MSENLDLVRSIFADWEHGDFSRTDWADPDIEWVFLLGGGLSPVTAKGQTEMRETARAILAPWAELRVVPEDYRELDSERVLVLDKSHGRGKGSGMEIGQFQPRSAHLFHVRNGKVTRLVVYDVDRDRALADLGLER
jgi:ketosteroid isomerase-like protein